MRRGPLSLILCALAAAALIVLAGCGGGGSGGSTSGQGEGTVGTLPDGVVAQVGGRDITSAQLDRVLEQQLAQMELQNQDPPEPGTDAYAEARRSALQNLVASRIYAIEAGRCGPRCRVSAREIEEQIDKVKRTSFNDSDAQFDAFLKRSKFTVADAQNLIRTQLQRQKIFASVTRPVRFTRAEALAYYRSHRQQYNNPELREARHILVPTRAKAQQLRAQITDTNFGELARANSIDPGSKDQGGELGIIVPGGFLPEFQKVVNELELNEVSQPFETQFGWEIVQVTKITPPEALPFEKVRSSIVQTQLQLRRQAALTKWQADVYQGWRKKTVYAERALLPAPLPTAPTGVTVTAPTTTVPAP